MTQYCYYSADLTFNSDGINNTGCRPVRLPAGTICRVIDEVYDSVYFTPLDCGSGNLWSCRKRKELTFVTEMQVLALAAAGLVPDNSLKEAS